MFRLDVGQNFFSERVGSALVQTAQAGGGVTVPEGVEEPWGCGTEGRGQWAWWGGLELDLVILEVFSNLSDCIVFSSERCRCHGVTIFLAVLTNFSRW